MKRSLILESGTRAVFHTVLVFSLFLLFTGHNAPGGGFVGGLVAAAALVLRFVAAGSEELGRTGQTAPEALLGTGVLLAAGTGAASWLSGEEFLTSGTLEVALPLLGKVKLTSVLVFDVGVYLVVVGLVAAVLDALGAELEA